MIKNLNVVKARAKLLAMRVIPKGADQLLPLLVDDAGIDPGSPDSIRLWNELMPQYAGLLEAQVQGKSRFDPGVASF